jgi:hypothetical protein
MLKSFIKTNLYFIIGCLVIVIVTALLSQITDNLFEGLATIADTDYVPVQCNSNWVPIVPSDSGFYFKSNNYKPIYVVDSAEENITNLFKANLLYNVDCSNTLYSKKPDGTFKKYLYDGKDILFENYSTGSFYDCLKKLIHETKPTLFLSYDSEDANDTSMILTFSYDGGNNIKNTSNIKLNLTNEGKEIVDKKITNNSDLSKRHPVYNNDIVKGYLIWLDKTQPQDVKYNIRIYKKDDKKYDILNSQSNLLDINFFLQMLDSLILNTHIKTIHNYHSTMTYNLALRGNENNFICGIINYGGYYCYSICQINA